MDSYDQNTYSKVRTTMLQASVSQTGGSRKVSEMWFFNYIKIKNYNGKVKKKSKFKKGKNKAYIIRRIYPSPSILYGFWHSSDCYVQQTCPTLSTEAFSSSYICEVGFSVMARTKTKFGNKLQLSNSLRLRTIRIGVDVNAVINSTQKHAPITHVSLWEINRSSFL
jgi:hypothetical protein